MKAAPTAVYLLKAKNKMEPACKLSLKPARNTARPGTMRLSMSCPKLGLVWSLYALGWMICGTWAARYR